MKREATSTSYIESKLIESKGRDFKKVVINRELYGEGFRREILRTKRPAPGLSPPEHSLAKRKCPAFCMFNPGSIATVATPPTICDRDISRSAVARTAVDRKHQRNSCR